jgi:hypothetical protein
MTIANGTTALVIILAMSFGIIVRYPEISAWLFRRQQRDYTCATKALAEDSQQDPIKSIG